MKPILSQKAPRLTDANGRALAEPIKEWQDAEHHLTHDGQVDFMQRMKTRIAAADALRKANAKEATTKVRCITPTGRKS